jgi:hypothetical protein
MLDIRDINGTKRRSSHEHKEISPEQKGDQVMNIKRYHRNKKEIKS